MDIFFSKASVSERRKNSLGETDLERVKYKLTESEVKQQAWRETAILNKADKQTDRGTTEETPVTPSGAWGSLARAHELIWKIGLMEEVGSRDPHVALN